MYLSLSVAIAEKNKPKCSWWVWVYVVALMTFLSQHNIESVWSSRTQILTNYEQIISIKQNVMMTCVLLHHFALLFVTKAALTCRGMDYIRPLKVFCGIWHKDVSGWSKVSMEWTLSDWTGKCAGQMKTSKSLWCYSKYSWSIFCFVAVGVILRKGTTAIGEYHFH